MTLVSVIIPTHDRAAFVGGAIETVLAQTHDDFEIVVVNDGSTDGTRAVLDAYAARDDRVRAFHRPVNRSIANGRNYALAHARGEYVCVLDDDDRWHPEKIAAQLAVMEGLDEEWGVVYTGGVVRRAGRTIGTYRPRDDRQGDVYPEVLVAFGLQPYSGHMMRRECFERVGGYDPDLGCGEDWDHAIRLAREYKFACVPELLVERLFHADNASRERRRTHGSAHGDGEGEGEGKREGIPLRIEEGTGPYGRIWGKYRAEIERFPDVERRHRARRELACARAELADGNRTKALRHGRAAFSHDPSVDAALVSTFACLGPRVLSLARGLRNIWADRRLDPDRAHPAGGIEGVLAAAAPGRDYLGSQDRGGGRALDPRRPDRLARPVGLGPLVPNAGPENGRPKEIEEL
jgi:glycosyltransferase involved in cell wall biosynthesis